MKIINRLSNLLVIAVLILAAGGFVFTARAFASVNTILDTRSITMSTSASGATNVQYSIGFKIGTTASVGGIAIVFCVEDPIPGDTCTIPTSMNVNRATTTVNSQTGFSGFTVSATGANNQINVVNATPQAMTQGTATTIVLGNGSTNGITNPTYATSTGFYARILTYATSGAATGSSPTVPGTYIDSGGIALYITAQLVITSKVQEQLALCIYTGANCGAGGTAITLGDPTTGVLSTAGSYTNVTGHFTASTNASGGMTIFAQGTTLTSPVPVTIAAIGATAAASATGTEQFGFCIGTTGGSITAFGQYNINNTNCNAVTTGLNTAGSAQFAFDVTSSPNMTTAGGMKVASASGPSTTTTGQISYLANISVTTKAGVYTTTQTFVGIGTF